MEQFSEQQLQAAADQVYPGLTMYARDASLPAAAAAGYTAGQILCSPEPVAASARFMGMVTTHRYVILSNHMHPVDPERPDSGLYAAGAGSHYKVLGTQTLGGRMGIFLLHLPDGPQWKLFAQVQLPMDSQIYREAVELFGQKVFSQPLPEHCTRQWLEICAEPVGMDLRGNRYPLEEEQEEQPEQAEDLLRDRFRGCLLGGAVGDALGYPIEFLSEPRIAAAYGPRGIRTLDQAGIPAEISDDTQMTLFAVNALVYAKKNSVDLRTALWIAYREWLGTQGSTSRMEDPAHPRMELYQEPRLHALRAPGNTCISSISGSPNGGTMSHPINNSKGCGTVMRAAPFGLAAAAVPDPEEAQLLAGEMAAVDAALTHGHSLAWESSAVLAKIIVKILRAEPGQDLEQVALDGLRPRDFLLRKKLGDAAHLARTRQISDLEAVHLLGEGWVAEEALAIGLFGALRYSDDIAAGIRAAVNHKGDSDSTGAICGSILGAWLGEKALRRAFRLEDLELEDKIIEMADLLYDTLFPAKETAEEPQEEEKPEAAAPEKSSLKPLRQTGLIYTELTKKALAICFDAHKHQKDRSGLPYIFHPVHVAEQLETEEEICTALLHDVLEDSFYDERDLQQAGFPESVLEAIRLLTRKEGEDYLAYVSRVRTDPIARRVKLADLTHNSDLARLDRITDQDRSRTLRYAMAMAILADDPWDETGRTACKTIPLSEDGTRVLKVTYGQDRKPICYEVAAGEDAFRVDPGSAAHLLQRLAPGGNLPMLLAEYGQTHGWDFSGLFL